MNEREIIICRCEDVTLADLRQLLRAGVENFEEIKRLLRCTMGPCQGRTCRDLVLRELSRHTGRPVGELAVPTYRPPFSPVKLGALADSYREEEDHD